MSLQVSLSTVSRVLFFCCLVSVSLIALLPQTTVDVFTLWDKVNHFLAFFVLLWLMDYSWPVSLALRNKALLLLSFGFLIELAQLEVARTFSLWDWLADAIGLSGYAIFRQYFLELRFYLERLPFIRAQIPLDGE